MSYPNPAANFDASDFLVLGVETSCDETGLALYGKKNGIVGLLGQVLHSQIALHAEYGGVVPELASRDHIKRLAPLLDALLQKTNTTRADISAVAYTEGPGLMGALMTGALFARALAYALGVPALGVHHMEGHLLAPLMRLNDVPNDVAFPFVALLVSGGHSELILAKGLGDYQLLGDTVDDALGECFDKVGKLLGLAYPAGATIERLAKDGAPIFKLPIPMQHRGLDFSFSGLKTAVHNLIKDNPNAKKADIAASFQAAAINAVVLKCTRAIKQTGLNTLVMAGGVSANAALRAALGNALDVIGARVYYAPTELCTDNGAMIAHAGYLRLLAGQSSDLAVQCKPRWDITTLPLVEVNDKVLRAGQDLSSSLD